jgi:hypothetical protein
MEERPTSPPFDRRRFLAGSLGTAGIVGAGTLSAGALLSACTGASESRGGAPATTAAPASGPPTDLASALAAPGSPGLIDEALYQRRVAEYLAFATAKLDVQSPTGIVAQLVRAHREPGYTWDTSAATVDSLHEVWVRFDDWMDTRDFRVMYLHWMLAMADGSSPSTTLSPELLATTKRYLLNNRYRYNDPLPDGVIDNQWYWSENHQMILLACEYLAGKRFPTDTFTITGLTGAQHAKRSRQPILDWIDERARFGFFEWHSNVYMELTMGPLMTLAELDDDPELVRAAGMALDLCLLDVAAHTHQGVYVASRGRSYTANKVSGRADNTFTLSKLLFADTDIPYANASDFGAIYLCAAKRYRPPQALIDMATAPQPGVVRERHGIFVDGSAPVTDNPEAPFGYDFKDPANLTFWWSQGALGMWQVTDISLAEAKKFRLFEGTDMAPIKVLVDLNGGDPARVKAWTRANHNVVNFGHAREVNSYAWRGDHVSLATAVDYRFGQMRDQAQVWVAAVDADAMVFANHPRTNPDMEAGWPTDGKPGYWTGEASCPRSAQHERTAIHIYQPAWDAATVDPLLWAAFKYRDYTHAFFPQDHFDEVIQTGHWTVGRKGDGYIALWSWRQPTWREDDPAQLAAKGMIKQYDLLANGGPDNVWVVEVGENGDGDFTTWKGRVTSSEPTVARSDAGFTVRWTSPSAGDLSFGSTGDFTVKGQAQPLADFPRHTSRFGTVDRLSKTYAIASDRARLRLDFTNQTRTLI